MAAKAQTKPALSAGFLVRVRLSPVIHGIRIITSDGSEARLCSPDVACTLVRLQAEDRDVMDATELWAQREHDWITLYKVYEIIERSGMLREVAVAAGASQTELATFRRTAQHPSGAGLAGARHARCATTPPDEPMHVWKAEGLVGRLLLHWLVGKAQGAPGCRELPQGR